MSRVVCILCVAAVRFASASGGPESATPTAASSASTLNAASDMRAEATGSRRLEQAKAATPSSRGSASSLAAYRYKLAQSFCPEADAADKALLACRNYEISRQMKAASNEAEKKKLSEARKSLYSAAAAKPESEKKTAAAALKGFYVKAWRRFCQDNALNEVCSSELMKKMYGGSKPLGARKAKKHKM